jgi:hypothetical protein
MKRYKILSIAEGNRFSFHSEMEIAEGFYAILCFAGSNVTPIAYGACGNLPYDLFTLTRQVFSEPTREEKNELNKNLPPTNLKDELKYNDELVANDNYYQKEGEENAKNDFTQNGDDAPIEGGDQDQSKAERHHLKSNEDGAGVRHAFGTETDGYYQSIKGELSALFNRYPQDATLESAYPASEWVRVKGEEGAAEELVGLIYESGIVKYVCYAVPARVDTPQEIKDQAYFVPVSPLTPDVGYYVLYQSAATGESIPKKEA